MFINKEGTAYEVAKGVGCFAARTAAKCAVAGVFVTGTALGIGTLPLGLGHFKAVQSFVLAGAYLGANALGTDAAKYVGNASENYVDGVADAINGMAEFVTELKKELKKEKE